MTLQFRAPAPPTRLMTKQGVFRQVGGAGLRAQCLSKLLFELCTQHIITNLTVVRVCVREVTGSHSTRAKNF